MESDEAMIKRLQEEKAELLDALIELTDICTAYDMAGEIDSGMDDKGAHLVACALISRLK